MHSGSQPRVLPLVSSSTPGKICPSVRVTCTYPNRGVKCQSIEVGPSSFEYCLNTASYSK